MIVSEAKIYPPYYQTYLAYLNPQNSLKELLSSRTTNLDFYHSIPDDKWDYQYAEGKWTIKQIIRHCIDAELIFNYRALSFVRGEKNRLLGWSENDYAANIHSEKFTKPQLIKSLSLQWEYTEDLFQNFSEGDLRIIGNANNYDTEVGAIGFAIVAHEIHHRNIIQERYLTT